MKVITLGRRWRRRIDATTVEEYPKGSTATVSNERAAAAERAGVLDGPPLDPPSGGGEEDGGQGAD